MTARLSVRVAIVLLKATAGLSIILGLLPFRYSFSKRTIEESRSMLFYSIALYLAIGIALCFVITDVQTNIDLSFYSEKPLNTIITVIEIATSGLAMFVTLNSIWRGRQQLTWIFNEVKAIYEDNLRRYDSTMRHRHSFYRFVLEQSLLTLCQIILGSYLIVNVFSIIYYDFALVCLLYGTLQCVVILIKNHFNNAILFVGIGFEELNKDLKTIVEKCNFDVLKHSAEDMAFAIHKAALTYERLLVLSKRIVSFYQLPVFLLIVSCVISNITNCYFILVFIKHELWKYDMSSSLLLPQVVVMNQMEFWSSVMVVEFTKDAASRTAEILRRFGSLGFIDDASIKALETFSLFCSHNEFRIRLCELINLDHRTGFAVTETSLLYLIYLVQFDYLSL